MSEPTDATANVGHWLALLREGTESEQQEARTELGLILEARGLLDEAAEAYIRNVEAGVTDRRPYERLAALARGRGDQKEEARWLRALADVLAPPTPQPAAEEEKPPVPQPPLPRAGEGEQAASVRAGRSRQLQVLLVAVLVPVLVLLVGGLLTRPEASSPTRVAPSPTTVELSLPVEAPSPFASPPATTTDSASQEATPATAMSPLTTPLMTAPLSQAAHSIASPTLVPTVTPTPLPERCADAAIRFPESRDAEEAVRVAFREFMARQGVTNDPNSTLFAGLGQAYAQQHAEVVAGWMAVTLQREHRGLPAFSLADFVASDVIVPTGANAYQFRPTVSPQGWAEMRSLPATSCAGAFMANPVNARWVELMAASVGDITWALPTPVPAR